MATVTLKGNPIKLEGNLPKVGDAAPDFKVVKEDLSEFSLSDYKGKIKVLLAVPSLDTPVCAKETRTFNEKMGKMANVAVIVISGDLPFAMKRYCAAEGIENVVTGSQYRDMNFSRAYGTHIAEGPLRALSARAVFVVDAEDKIAHVELVPEIAAEPKYDEVTLAVQQVLRTMSA